jgi:hypothetical protein
MPPWKSEPRPRLQSRNAGSPDSVRPSPRHQPLAPPAFKPIQRKTEGPAVYRPAALAPVTPIIQKFSALKVTAPPRFVPPPPTVMPIQQRPAGPHGYRPASASPASPIVQRFSGPRMTAPPRFVPPPQLIRPSAPGARVVQRMETDSPGLSSSSPKSDIDPFVMKASESRGDSDIHTRSYSASSHYDFRHTPSSSYLPQSGPDPTEKRRSLDGYYYHVTSYINLAKILQDGLNPDAGGKVGGSSYQNADANMNQVSATDSQSKVFVATVSKLTERYLSFRLRQEDLINKHRDWVVTAICERKTCNRKSAATLLERFQTGELPLVLRFRNVWAPKQWEHDKTDTAAFALVGTPVLPAQIECLSTGGWLPLTTLTEVAVIFQRADFETNFRKGLLRFFGEYNAELEKMDKHTAEYKLGPELVKALAEANF